MTDIKDPEEVLTSAISVACNIDRSKVTTDASMLDLGIDSITMTAIVVQLQAVFDVQLEQDEVIDLLNAPRVGDVLTLMRVALTARRAVEESGQEALDATTLRALQDEPAV